MPKTQTVAEVMTKDPVVLAANAAVDEAARAMRDSDIGDVIVMDDGTICGIVTDRDIVVRAIATGKEPSSTALKDICSQDVTTIQRTSSIGDAVKLMREKAVRRLPVVDGGRPVGVLSIGDLAVERDPESALADISEAPPNQ